MNQKMKASFLLPMLCALMIALCSCTQAWAKNQASQAQNPIIYFAFSKINKEWKKELTPMQYNLLIEKGTELLSSNARFDSHTDWPGFDKAMGNDIGSDLLVDGKAIDTVVLAGGCFWSMQAIFQKLKGVTNVTVGYSGGNKANPTYEEVGSGNTGYAESIQIAYQPAHISLTDILKVFFSVHNPTTFNRQGADIGTQYRSVVFYNNAEQKAITDRVIKILTESQAYSEPIVTQVVANKAFYSAEKYHQDYYNNNKGEAYCSRVVAPKIEKFEKAFQALLKENQK